MYVLSRLIVCVTQSWQILVLDSEVRELVNNRR
jgi:hypothetical protein